MIEDFAISADRGAWLEGVRRDRNASSAAFRVAHAIATHANEDGSLSLTLRALADLVGVTPPTLAYGLDRLAGRRHIALRRGPAGRPVLIRILRSAVPNATAQKSGVGKVQRLQRLEQ